MKTITLKMAVADKKDQDAMFLLIGILSDVFESSSLCPTPFPRGIDGEYSENDPDTFDEEDPEHLRILFDRIRSVIDKAPGAMNRVVWGYNTLCLPKNQIIDPDLDHLAPHPRIGAMENIQNIARELIAAKGRHNTGLAYEKLRNALDPKPAPAPADL